MRSEFNNGTGLVQEGPLPAPSSKADWPSHNLVFIDSRWAHAYKVGDVIAECTPDNLPPDGVAIVDAVGDVGQMDGTRLGWACGGDVTWGPSVGERSLPFTVIYVPETEGEA